MFDCPNPESRITLVQGCFSKRKAAERRQIVAWGVSPRRSGKKTPSPGGATDDCARRLRMALLAETVAPPGLESNYLDLFLGLTPQAISCRPYGACSDCRLVDRWPIHRVREPRPEPVRKLAVNCLFSLGQTHCEICFGQH